MKTKKVFKDIQDEWYEIIKKDGFEDIEDTSLAYRPLKKWTADVGEYTSNSLDKLINVLDFYSHQEPGEDIKSNFPHPVFYADERLLLREDFDSICEYVCSHGNRGLMPYQIKDIWQKYVKGDSYRSIAKQTDIYYATVYRIVVALRKWK